MEWEDEAEVAFDKLFAKHIRSEGLTSGKARMVELAMRRAVEENARARGSARVSLSDVLAVLGPDPPGGRGEEAYIRLGVSRSSRAVAADLILIFMLRSLRGEKAISGEVHLSHLV